MRRMVAGKIAALISMLFLLGCGGGGGSGGNEANDTVPPSTVSKGLKALSDEKIAKLNETERLRIVSKLYATLYKGFDVQTLRTSLAEGDLLNDLRQTLHRRDIVQPDREKIFIDDYTIPYNARAGDRLFEKRWRIYAQIASTLYYTRLSREYFDEWLAYILEQTIMFSPAYEVDSVKKFPELIASNHQRIRNALAADEPISQIVYEHMSAKENWARFRSPEDNGRGMLEIWLYDYEDAHVPLAAKALRNWRWEVRREKNSEGEYGDVYRFYNDENNPDEINTEPVTILGESVTTGSDFYRMISEHPRLIPTVTDRLVNLFFPTFKSEEKKRIVEAILEGHPRTFREIVEQIIFSEKYLLESDRIKSPEEIYMPLNRILGMEPTGTSFRYFFTRCLLPGNQAPFTYKLGRLDEGVDDTDSVVRIHQYIRSAVFLNRRKDGWDAGALRERYDAATLQEYLEHLFIDLLGRGMSDGERRTLTAIASDAGIDPQRPRDWDKFAMTLLAFDYLSRLSEIYTYSKISTEGGK